MACKCDCFVTILPYTLGGTGCGFEVVNGIVYAIGKQEISADFSDPCNILTQIYINGVPMPSDAGVLVNDGEAINFSIATRTGVVCGLPVAFCNDSLFSYTGRGLRINKKMLLQRIKSTSRKKS